MFHNFNFSVIKTDVNTHFMLWKKQRGTLPGELTEPYLKVKSCGEKVKKEIIRVPFVGLSV